MKGIVACVLATTAFAGDLKLTWQDCGDASTHAKITSFTPDSLTTGQTASMVGTGNLDEDVAGASFDVEMNGVIHLLSCKGDASQSKTCNLPLGAGKLTFDAMTFPIKKGQVQVKFDLTLASSLPSSLLKTKTKATATGANGDKLFCLEIDSAPAEASHAVVVPTPPPLSVASDLKLTWQDCGDASTHAKITGFTPGSLTTGQTASMIGTGNLDEDVAGASFDVEMD